MEFPACHPDGAGYVIGGHLRFGGGLHEVNHTGEACLLHGCLNSVLELHQECPVGYSQDVESYDRATELESIGYNILSMPAGTWRRINQPAA